MTAAMAGLATLLAGVPATAATIYYGTELVLNFWQHANVRPIPGQATLGIMIMTPDRHRLHHREDFVLQNANFGPVLAIWDWMFGSLRSVPEAADARFGLSPAKWTVSRTLSSLLIAPFRSSRPVTAGGDSNGTTHDARARQPL